MYSRKISSLITLGFATVMLMTCVVLSASQTAHAAQRIQEALSASHLTRAKVYIAAGDYRRAIEACQQYLDEHPSVEGYVYLAYVYETIEGYLAALQKNDDWVKVQQVSLNLMTREMIDLIDPPDVMPRMTREMIGEGIRQQFDITAAMANRLDQKRTEELWVEQTVWREKHPDNWWSGVPIDWNW